MRKCLGHEIAAVDGIDIDIPKGQCWGLLGPDGAGKTTFFRTMVDKTSPSTGDLQVLGYSVPREATVLCARIGMVPQHDNLDPDAMSSSNRPICGPIDPRGDQWA